VLSKRIIVCLDVDHGGVFKGTRFRDLRRVGDPVELADRYQDGGADEVVFLDISASHEGRGTLLEVVRRTAERLFVPLTVGGGIGDVEGIGALLRSGADKVSINSAAVRRPELLTEGAARFGRQCIVASIDAARTGDGYTVRTHGGRRETGIEAIGWARQCAERGAGEILLTAIDRDGARDGYDLELTRRVANAVSVPVIASGGAGEAVHFAEAFDVGADAALAAGIFHDGTTTVRHIKRQLLDAGVSVRPEAVGRNAPAAGGNGVGR
jgi:cyclase